MKFVYRAVSPDGKTTSGFVEAKDPHDVAAYIRKENLIPIKIEKQVEKSSLFFIPGSKRISTNDLIFFTQQLSSMLLSGLTLIQSLNILKGQIKKPAMQQMLEHIIGDIEEGETLSNALQRYPAVFSPVYISLIKAAETSGLLDKVLARLAENLEKSQRLRSSIKGAFMYPAIVFSMMIVVIAVILIFVIPTLSGYYSNLNAKLPVTTQILLSLSGFVINFWWLAILGVIAGVIGFRKWYSTLPGKMIIDRMVLKLPIFGKLIIQSTVTEFSRTFGLMVGTGSLIVDSLEKSADIVNNIHYKDAIHGIATRVEKGITIGDAMSYTNMFPPLLIEMTKIGEQTGKLDESLTRASQYFERETEKAVKTMTTLLEPMIMVVLGLGVGFLLISILQPIFQLNNLF